MTAETRTPCSGTVPEQYNSRNADNRLIQQATNDAMLMIACQMAEERNGRKPAGWERVEAMWNEDCALLRITGLMEEFEAMWNNDSCFKLKY